MVMMGGGAEHGGRGQGGGGGECAATAENKSCAVGEWDSGGRRSGRPGGVKQKEAKCS